MHRNTLQAVGVVGVLCAGGAVVFTDTAVDAITPLSQGWHRLVYILASHYLLYGWRAKKEHIDEEVVRLAAKKAVIFG